MQVQIERMMDSRVAILSLVGEIGGEDTDTLRDALSEVFQAGSQPHYLIIDARRLRVAFNHLNAFMRQQRSTRTLENTYATQLDLPPIFVGTSPLVETYISVGLPHAFRTDRAPVFSTRDEALAYIKTHMGRRQVAR